MTNVDALTSGQALFWVAVLLVSMVVAGLVGALMALIGKAAWHVERWWKNH